MPDSLAPRQPSITAGQVPAFIHLRVRTKFSLCRGMIDPKELAKLAAKHDMPALGVAEVDALHGALDISSTLAKAGIQPIVGCDLSLDNPDRTTGRVLLMPKSPTGWCQLLRIIDRNNQRAAEPEGRRLGVLELIDGFDHDQLLCLVGRPDSVLGHPLVQRQEQPAIALTERLLDGFRDRLFLEIARHGMDIERRIEPALLNLADRYGIPLVATNDVCFTNRDDEATHAALLAIDAKATLNDPDRPRLTPLHHFRSPAEMLQAFADLPEAIANTKLIAQRVALVIKPAPKPMMPRFLDDPDPAAEAIALQTSAAAGFDFRLPEIPPDQIDDYRIRLDYELEKIVAMGFAGYFLIVSDLIQWAKNHDIPVGPGRGSGAGSIVAWCLRITEIDPLRFGLLFERFLNPERVSLPDFDIDFCPHGRDDVVRYVRERYGADRVAAIATIGRIQARAAVQDAGRLLGLPHTLTNGLAGRVPTNPSDPIPLATAIAQDPQLKRAFEADARTRELLDLATRIEGFNRQSGIHAAGVVIGDRPLVEIVPMTHDPSSPLPIIEYPMKAVEKLGLLKFDFLRLKTLTVIDEAIKNIRALGSDLDPSYHSLDDPDTFALIARSDTLGIFQLESAGMNEAIRLTMPDRFDDIIALVALYRPGPMDQIPVYAQRKAGQRQAEYLHPLMEDVLSRTHGVMIYQEQVIEVAQRMARFSGGKADLLRRAMGKKIKEEMDAQKADFIAGCIGNGIEGRIAEAVFDQIERFAAYGFNKSHAAAYAVISYQTAWLKAHHRAAFMAAAMNSHIGKADKLGLFRQDLKRAGVRLLPPDVMRSKAGFTVELADGAPAVRFGLAALRGIGDQATRTFCATRPPALTVRSAIAALRGAGHNASHVAILVSAGAFDPLEANRAAVLQEAEESARPIDPNQGVFDFGTVRTAPPPWGMIERARREFDALGFYLQESPLAGVHHRLKALANETAADLIASLTEAARSGEATLAGLFISGSVINHPTNAFVELKLEDHTASFLARIDLARWDAIQPAPAHGSVLLVTGTPKLSGQALTLQHASVVPVAINDIAARIRDFSIDDLEPLRLLCDAHAPKPGHRHLSLSITMGAEDAAWHLELGFPVSGSDQAINAVKALFGDRLVFETHDA